MSALEIYTICYNPTDFPEKYVVRRFQIDRDGLNADPEPLIVCDFLHEARTVIPNGLYCLSRQERDEPLIVECWI